MPVPPYFDPYASENTPEQKAARIASQFRGAPGAAPGGAPAQPIPTQPPNSFNATTGQGINESGIVSGASLKAPGAGARPGEDPIYAFIRERGSKAGADPSALSDPGYWAGKISEHGGLTDANKEYFGYRMESDPNLGTGYYADRNSGKLGYDQGMPGGSEGGLLGLGSLFGSSASQPQAAETRGLPEGYQSLLGANSGQDANKTLQDLLAKLMGNIKPSEDR